VIYLYGGPIQKPIDDPTFFVQQQYWDLLERAPDESGTHYWVSQITQCGTDATCISNQRASVALAFWYSAEFLQHHAGLRNPPGTSPDFNNQEFARLCYVIYLQQDPSQSQLDYWTNQLNYGVSYHDVVKAFIEDGDYRTRFDPAPPTPGWEGCNPTSEEIGNCENCCGVQTYWDYESCRCYIP